MKFKCQFYAINCNFRIQYYKWRKISGLVDNFGESRPTRLWDERSESSKSVAKATANKPVH